MEALGMRILLFLSFSLAALVGCSDARSGGGDQTSEALGSDEPNYDALDSAIVDSVLQRYSQPLPPAAVDTLPAAIVCGGNTIDAFTSQKLTMDSAGTEILLDQTDGDQVAGVFVSKADLEALASKRTAKIAAKSYSGYWWSDGSHYRFANVTCRLK
jgi:hypothetical protein